MRQGFSTLCNRVSRHSDVLFGYLALALVSLLTVVSAGCNHKVAEIPNGPGPGDWRLVLRAPAVMYRDHPGGRVANDTIVVRLYDSAGNIQNAVTIRSQALKSPNMVNPQVHSVSDTIAKPWGSDIPLFYYGSGDPDPALPEIVTSEAIINGDTVARAEARFLVHDPVQLMLFGRDTLYRNNLGFVNYDTLTMRLFGATGDLLGGVPVHCQCLISRDSVSALVSSYADTLGKPWGSNPAIRYWGGADRTEPQRMETVTCWAVVNGDTTTASKSFLVWDH